ncbi:MAG: RpiB/LacA/LacB family sugar-phosphate isomerase, partial [Tetragenococcus koreensis]|nr:RpiB/LacA/LacB family sugar-phosphate isomerase [Tetragenococcus koreensis]
MKLAIGSDHVGWELKQEISDYIQSLGHETVDFGAYSSE